MTCEWVQNVIIQFGHVAKTKFVTYAAANIRANNNQNVNLNNMDIIPLIYNVVKLNLALNFWSCESGPAANRRWRPLKKTISNHFIEWGIKLIARSNGLFD